MAFYFLLLASSLFADCEKCKIIREQNANRPPPKHEYYEDYLKSVKEEKEEEKIDFSEQKDKKAKD
jgi:hypothetical protein